MGSTAILPLPGTDKDSQGPIDKEGLTRHQGFHVHDLRNSVTFSGRMAHMKRWDGMLRKTSDWHALKKDPELWFPDGDCNVHLYARGQSQRGPSFRIPLMNISSVNCRPLLSISLDTRSIHASRPSSPRGSNDPFRVEQLTSKSFDLYLPAPRDLNREDAYQYHITTRNYFAWVSGLPIVGSSLGEALVLLMERINIYQKDRIENESLMLEYLDGAGYTDFRGCPDHCLAVMKLAERFQIRDLWVDTFCHSVGQFDNLHQSEEYLSISRVTAAMIGRAHRKMESRLEHAALSLSNFLEDELSGSHLGLRNEDRAHLDHFRSFLHAFYVAKYGYWPKSLGMSTLRSMYIDFRDLYEYLVDPESTTSIQNNRIAPGGLCVLQNVREFDRRKKFIPLPHPLPLMPRSPFESGPRRSSAPMQALNFFGGKQAKLERKYSVLKSLWVATNTNKEVALSNLVREYARFEKDWIMNEDETKVPAADARKVRWLLIYAVLQTLISATQAPKDVRDTEDVMYPLCCSVPEIPPWEIGGQRISRLNEEQHSNENKPAAIEIKPDLDYVASYSSNSLSRNTSVKSKSSLKRTLSLTCSVSKRCSKSKPKKPPNYCEIVVHGYGNGLNPTYCSDQLSSGCDIPEHSYESQPTESVNRTPSTSTTTSSSTVDDSPTSSTSATSWPSTVTTPSPSRTNDDGNDNFDYFLAEAKESLLHNNTPRSDDLFDMLSLPSLPTMPPSIQHKPASITPQATIAEEQEEEEELSRLPREIPGGKGKGRLPVRTKAPKRKPSVRFEDPFTGRLATPDGKEFIKCITPASLRRPSSSPSSSLNPKFRRDVGYISVSIR
ncbi:MAG: hypothetical protein M1834_000676 [Cirrosporium novae-zelandiae]|nr:MAG: hypothetical protein M1834_000676 [Cirrosporium novae-zelandiae]